MLSCALEQTLVVAGRVKEDISPLETDQDEHGYLVRTPQVSGGKLIWDDRQVLFPLEPFHIVPSIDPGAVARVRALRRSDSEFELECLSLPARVGRKGNRPRWPHALIAVEAESCQILGFELLEAIGGLPVMWSEMPGKLLSILSKSPVRPARVCVRSTLYREVLRPVLDEIEVDVVKRSELPAVEDVRESLFRHLSG